MVLITGWFVQTNSCPPCGKLRSSRTSQNNSQNSDPQNSQNSNSQNSDSQTSTDSQQVSLLFFFCPPLNLYLGMLCCYGIIMYVMHFSNTCTCTVCSETCDVHLTMFICTYMYSQSSLSRHSHKRTALLTAALSTKPFLNSSSYKLYKLHIAISIHLQLRTHFLLPEGVRLQELLR